jgi:hypothetical protein
LENTPSLELRRRVEQLLEHPMSAEALRTLRALAVLELVGTPEARRLLQTLSEGVAGAWLTQEAKAVYDRCDRARAP